MPVSSQRWSVRPKVLRAVAWWYTSTAVACGVCGPPAFADAAASCAVSPAMPAAPTTSQTYSHQNGRDDTKGLQQALDALQPGDSLAVAPGIYEIQHHLTVSVAGVSIYGNGATLQFVNPSDGALWIKADAVSVYGFTIEQESNQRKSSPLAGGISVYSDGSAGRNTIHGSRIQGNTINSSAAVGIFILRVENFTIADNTVWRSWADGIHVTAGSFNGRVINNKISQTGDDMIAVVSYAANTTPAPAAKNYADWAAVQSALVRDIYIAGNTATDQYWGRGISVVGGSNITIENNSISKTATGAAIYLTRETSFMSFGDHNIVVRGNQLSDIQDLSPGYKPSGFNGQRTEQGAIEIGGTIMTDEFANPTWRNAFSLSRIALLNNSIDRSQYSGIRIGVGYAGSQNLKDSSGVQFLESWKPGQVQNVTVQNNILRDINSSTIVEPHSGLDQTSLTCGANSLAGVIWPSSCATAAQASVSNSAQSPPAVTGSTVQCSSNGELESRLSPVAPGAPQ